MQTLASQACSRTNGQDRTSQLGKYPVVPQLLGPFEAGCSVHQERERESRSRTRCFNSVAQLAMYILLRHRPSLHFPRACMLCRASAVKHHDTGTMLWLSPLVTKKKRAKKPPGSPALESLNRYHWTDGTSQSGRQARLSSYYLLYEYNWVWLKCSVEAGPALGVMPLSPR